MHKHFFSITTTILCSLFLQSASANNDTGWYIFGGAGEGSSDDMVLDHMTVAGLDATIDTTRGNDLVWRVGFGYRATKNIGVEFDYVRMRDVDTHQDVANFRLDQTSHVLVTNVFGVYYHPINNWFTPYLKMGVGGIKHHTEYKFSVDRRLIGDKATDTTLGAAGGLGLKFDVIDHVSVNVEGSAMLADDDLYYVTANLAYWF